MRFERLEIRNFLSYGAEGVTIDLMGKGAVLITGKDRSTGGHNGVGKSAIIDAFVWTLYGKPFRPISLDGIVNFSTGADTACAIELAIGRDRYRIERFRKHTEFNNQLYVYKNGQRLPLLSTSQEEQKRLERILGVSRNAFIENTIYTSDTQIFFTLSPQRRFQLLESRLNIEVFGAAATKARSLVKAYENERLVTETNINLQRTNLERLETDRKEYEAKAEDWERNKEHERARIQGAIVELEANLKEREGLLEERQRLEAEKTEILDKKAKLYDEHRELTNEINALSEAAREVKLSLEREKRELRAKVDLIKNSAKERIKSIRQRLDQLSAQECPVCERPLEGHGDELRSHLEAEIESIAKEVERQIEEETNRYETVARSLQERLKEVNIDKAEFERKLSDVEHEVEEIERQIAELDLRIANLLPDKRDIAILQKEIEDQRSRLRELDGNNPFLEVLGRIDAQIGETEEEIKKQESRLEEIEDELYYYKLWADAFKNDLKYYAVSSILPLLNERLNVALKSLFPNKDVGMKVHNTMEISIRFDGIPTSYWNLSQGERKRFDIALFAALYMVSRYVDPRSTSNVVWFDEIFDSGLDQQGISATLQLLRNLGADTFFVITHRAELSSIFDSVLELEKVNGITRARV